MAHHPVFLAALLAVPAALLAQAPADEWQVFLRLPAAQRAQLAKDLELPASPFVRAMQACIAATHELSSERTRRLVERHGKRVVAQDEAPDEPLPQGVRYLFGIGAIELLRPPSSPLKKGPSTAQPSAEEPTACVQQALLGVVPGADRALANLLQRLDQDTSADEFAAFVHSWRNGDESFYEALDRTAGTKDSVFFYDAMLGDFRTQFVRGDSASARAVRGSLQAAHDALHDAFLAYRQYRGFREAVAWSLVLPPELPLPRRLKRYEAAVAGAYSLRQQVLMVCHLLDDDVQRVAAEIVRTAPPLPVPLWSGSYDPYPAWNALFASLLPRMIETAESSDAFLERARQQRSDEAAAIAAAARSAIAPH